MMSDVRATPVLADRLIDALHVEALVLADEANAYFAGPGKTECDALGPRDRVVFACEALKASTRSVQLVAWLAGRRAGGAQVLAPAADSAQEVLAELPSAARRLVLAGIELHQRARRLAESGDGDVATISPARSLFNRLERSF